VSASGLFPEEAMETLIERAAGLDVHQATVVACVVLEPSGLRPKRQTKTFSTVRAGLQELRDWLTDQGVTHLAMEGTGVYWMAVYAMLEDVFDVAVVNARHVKNLPGRKTDVNDAAWLAELLRKGMLRKSFVPAKEIRAIRDVCRYRRMLVQSETSEKNRVLKLLEVIGLKLATFASDVFGTSGMAMLQAIAAGPCSAQQVASLARGRLRSKLPELQRALDCLVAEHHRMMLRDQLARLERTGQEIARYDQVLADMVKPYSAQLELLCTIVGVQRKAATEIFAEIGPDLGSFPSCGHFSSWAGMCPGQNQSAGKKGRARRRRGNPYLQSILVECALAATRKKDSYHKDKYHRIKARRGAMRALFATAHDLARAVYRVLTTRSPHRDLGAGFLDRRRKPAIARNLVKRLRALGYDQHSILALLPQPTTP
jgi:transposase